MSSSPSSLPDSSDRGAVGAAPAIVVAPSGVHGLGAFAARPIDAGERIGVYAGRRYTASRARRRDWNVGLTYVFGLSDGSIVDAADGGNATRHFNHSCEPNCVAYEETGARRTLQVVFYALRAIAAGEELTVDYSLSVDESEDPSSFGCDCRAPECRGTMLAV